jgi:uncharacterized protein
MEAAGYFAAIFVGLILGLLGGGGSILSIPILVYLFHIEPVKASGYSLFIVGITSLVGAVPKYKDHLVNFKTGLLFGIPSIITIFCTRRWVVPNIPETILQIDEFVLTRRLLLLGVFAFLMILASISMLRKKVVITHEDHRYKVQLLTLEGVIIGFLTGLVGAGGGFLIIPALVLLTGLPFKTAVGTSLVIIGINSIVGFVGDLLNYEMDWIFLLTIKTLAVGGILLGHQMSTRVNQIKLRHTFGWFVLVTGTYIMVREFWL